MSQKRMPESAAFFIFGRHYFRPTRGYIAVGSTRHSNQTSCPILPVIVILIIKLNFADGGGQRRDGVGDGLETKGSHGHSSRAKPMSVTTRHHRRTVVNRSSHMAREGGQIQARVKNTSSSSPLSSQSLTTSSPEEDPMTSPQPHNRTPVSVRQRHPQMLAE